MLTFAAFVAEAHDPESPYIRWGVIHPSGRVIDGVKHRSARTHEQLKLAKATDKDRVEHFADYSEEPGRNLTFRTYPNKKSVGAGLKALKKMHSPTGEYTHEHDNGHGGLLSRWSHVEGPEHVVAAHLRKIHRQLG